MRAVTSPTKKQLFILGQQLTKSKLKIHIIPTYVIYQVLRLALRSSLRVRAWIVMLHQNKRRTNVTSGSKSLVARWNSATPYQRRNLARSWPQNIVIFPFHAIFSMRPSGSTCKHCRLWTSKQHFARTFEGAIGEYERLNSFYSDQIGNVRTFLKICFFLPWLHCRHSRYSVRETWQGEVLVSRRPEHISRLYLSIYWESSVYDINLNK